MATLAHISLGSNLGDRRATLDAALAELAGSPGVIVRRASRYYATDPVGGPSGQGAFLNAAAALETTNDAPALLRLLHEVEAKLGRVRVERWGERTLDLDLLLYGEQRIDTEELVVPHPRMALRRFVLVPLAELASGAIDPFTGHTIAGLLANLDRRPGYIALSNSLPCWLPTFRDLADSLNAVTLPFAPLSQAFDAQFGTAEEKDEVEALSRIAIEHQARELHARRWSAETWNDRWILTDYWLDETILDSVRLLSPPNAGEFGAQFLLQCLASTLKPTFVVTGGMPPQIISYFHYHQQSRSRLTGWSPEAPPTLRVYSRSGLPDMPHRPADYYESKEARLEYRQASAAYERAWTDAVVTEVLAACEASRARVEPT